VDPEADSADDITDKEQNKATPNTPPSPPVVSSASPISHRTTLPPFPSFTASAYDTDPKCKKPTEKFPAPYYGTSCRCTGVGSDDVPNGGVCNNEESPDRMWCYSEGCDDEKKSKSDPDLKWSYGACCVDKVTDPKISKFMPGTFGQTVDEECTHPPSPTCQCLGRGSVHVPEGGRCNKVDSERSWCYAKGCDDLEESDGGHHEQWSYQACCDVSTVPPAAGDVDLPPDAATAEAKALCLEPTLTDCRRKHQLVFETEKTIAVDLAKKLCGRGGFTSSDSGSFDIMAVLTALGYDKSGYEMMLKANGYETLEEFRNIKIEDLTDAGVKKGHARNLKKYLLANIM
jgi:hypothetical protein